MIEPKKNANHIFRDKIANEIYPDIPEKITRSTDDDSGANLPSASNPFIPSPRSSQRNNSALTVISNNSSTSENHGDTSG